MEPLPRVLTLIALSMTAFNTAYALTVADLWWYVLQRVFWWATFGGGAFALLAAGSWWVVRVTRPTTRGSVIEPAHHAIAARIGPETASTRPWAGSSRAA